MRDLITNVIEQYAVYWKELGLKLGLQDYIIANIWESNVYNPNRIVACCTSILMKWLQIDPSPTWGKLNDVIKSFTATPSLVAQHYAPIPSVSLGKLC